MIGAQLRRGRARASASRPGGSPSSTMSASVDELTEARRVVGLRRGRARRCASTCCSSTTTGCARGPASSSTNGPYGAAGVAARRLDDDHVGAEVGEQLARERGVLARELDHAQPVERAASRRHRERASASTFRPWPAGRSRRRRARARSREHRSLCSPRHGPPRSIDQSVSERCTGMPSTRTSPISEWCAVGHRPHVAGAGIVVDAVLRPRHRRRRHARRRAAAPRSSNRSRVRVHAAMSRVERVLRRERGRRAVVVARVGGPRLVDHRRRGASSRRRHGTRSRPSRRRPPTGRCRAAPSRGLAVVGVGCAGASRAAGRSPCSRGGRDRPGRCRPRCTPCRPTGPRRCGCGGSARRGSPIAMKLAPMWSMYEKPQPAGGWPGSPRAEREPAHRLHDRPPRLERGVRAAARRSRSSTRRRCRA